MKLMHNFYFTDGLLFAPTPIRLEILPAIALMTVQVPVADDQQVVFPGAGEQLLTEFN